MEKLKGHITFLTNGQEKAIQFTPKTAEFCIGNDPFADIFMQKDPQDTSDDVTCKIYLSSLERVKIQDITLTEPILVNGEKIEGKKELKSGDVITIAGRQLRWELKSDVKRRTAMLPKELRKELKHKYIKTQNRITIHNIRYPNPDTSSSIQEHSSVLSKEDGTSSSDKNNTENPIDSSISPDSSKGKENTKTPAKMQNLNSSGILLTTYTPPAKIGTRSASRTPYNTPLKSSFIKSASKSNVLNESLNVQKLETPTSATKLNSSSMHLIDLTTPYVQRAGTSTPKTAAAAASLKKTPKTVSNTPLRNQTLLKSALKNSTKQVAGMQQSGFAAAKAKVLFESPARDSCNSSPSIIEVSSSSYSSTFDSPQNSSIDFDKTKETVAEAPAKIRPTTSDDVKDLLATISSVLNDNGQAENENQDKSTSTGCKKETTAEEDFEELVKQQGSSIVDENQSLFEKAANEVPNELIDDFDKLVEESAENEETIEKKSENVLKLIADARKSLAPGEPNNTNQVMSSRFSNITPNDSLVDTQSSGNLQKYDVTTPKISILSTVDSGLTISPVSRLSVARDSTEIVENYQLNSNIPKSLRSTRKRIGSAIASLHNVSQNSEVHFDANETFNVTDNNDQNDAGNQSQVESADILSLDEQQQQEEINTSNKENEPAGNNSISFYESTYLDENNEIVRDIFEFDNSNNEDVVDSDEDELSSEEDENVEEEFLDEEHLETSENPTDMKFRLSQEDLEEDGIKPLDISKGDNDDDDEIIFESQEANDELPESSQPETTDIEEIFDSQEFEMKTVDEAAIEEKNDDELLESSQEERFDQSQEELEMQAISELPTQLVEDDNETIEEQPEKLNNEGLQEKVSFEILETQSSDEKINSESEELEHVELPETQPMLDSQDDELENTIKEAGNETGKQESANNYEYDDEVIPCSQPDDGPEETTSYSHRIKSKSFSNVEVPNETAMTNSQDVNKSESDFSIQEISSDNNTMMEEQASKQPSDEDIFANTDDAIYESYSDEIINKSIVDQQVEDNCMAQESRETLNSLDTNDSDTINELIQAPTDILTDICGVQNYSSTGGNTEDASQNQESSDGEEKLQSEQDSAIESSNKVDDYSQEEQTEKNVDDSALNMTQSPMKNRTSLFSDTEFSTVEISTSMINQLYENDTPTSTEQIQTHKNESNLENIEESEQLLQKQDQIHAELDKVDFDKKIPMKSHSILPSEIQKSLSSRQTIIPDKLNESFEELMEKKKEQMENDELENSHNVDDTSSAVKASESFEKYSRIEEELAKMNEEPNAELVNKKRPASMMPGNDDDKSVKENAGNSRMTLIPSTDDRRQSFLDQLEQEKAEQIDKKSLEIIEETPKVIIEEDAFDEIPSQQESEGQVSEDNLSVNSQQIKNESVSQPEDEMLQSQDVDEEILNEDELLQSDQEENIKEEEISQYVEVQESELAEKIGDTEPVEQELLETMQEKLQESGSEKEIQSAQAEEPESIKDEIIQPKNNAYELSDPEIVKKEAIEPETTTDEPPQPVTVGNEISQPEIVTDEILNPETVVNEPSQPEIVEDESTEPQAAQESDPEPIDKEPVIEETCIKKTAYVTTETEQPVAETPSKRRAVRINYSELATGSPARTRKRSTSTESTGKDEPKSAIKQRGKKHIKMDPIVEDDLVVQVSVTASENTKKVEMASEEVEKPLKIVEREKENIEEIKDSDEETAEEKLPENKEEEKVSPEMEVARVRKSQEHEIVEEKAEIHENNIEELKDVEKSDMEAEQPAKETETIEPKTPRKRAKKLNYLEMASGSPARATRRPRTASVDEKANKDTKLDIQPPETIEEETTETAKINNEAPKVDEIPVVEEKLEVKPKSSGRARKIEQPKVDEEPTPSKRSKRGATPIKASEPPRRAARKRQQAKHEAESEKPEPTPTEENNQQEVHNEPVKPAAAKRVRAKAKPVAVSDEKTIVKDEKSNEEPTTTKRTRKQPAPVEEPALEKPELSEPPKRARGRKVVEEENIEKSKPTKTSRKRAQTPVEVESAAEKIKEKSASPQVASKKRAATRKATETVHEEIAEQPKEEKATTSRRRGKATVPESPAPQKLEDNAPKRGKRTKNEVPAEENQPVQQQDEEVEAPKGKSRARKHKVEEPPKELEPVIEEPVNKRSRRAASTEPTVMATKKGSRRGKVDVQTEEPLKETISKRGKKDAVEVTEEATTSKKVRARNNMTDDESKEAESHEPEVKKGRGRQLKEDEISTPTKRSRKAPAPEESEPPAAKKGRGQKNKADDEPKEPESQPKSPPPAKRNARKHVTIVTPSTMQAKQAEEQRAGKQKAQKSATNESATLKTTDSVGKRPTRARK